MSTSIKSGSSSALANVDSNNNLNVINPASSINTGYVALAGRVEAGTYGTARGKAVNVTDANRIATAHSNILWDDNFSATAQNTSYYKFANASMTVSQASGYLTSNSGGATTSLSNCGIQTFRYFPLFGHNETRVVFSCQIPGAFPHAVNNTIEIGLLLATLGGNAAPTDGIMFRWNASGELRGVISYNGAETTTSAITIPSNGVSHDFQISISNETVLFFIDRELRGTITLLNDAQSIGRPSMMPTLPFTFRQYHSNPGPTTATKMQLSDVYIYSVGINTGRTWETSRALSTSSAYQGLNGGTVGSTALLSNSAVGSSAALSNTSPSGVNTGLGGLVQILPTLTAGTDGIVWLYQNPAAGINQPGRNLIIKGVKLQNMVTTVLNGGPVLYAFSLFWGSTSPSLATSESTSYANGTTKAPRRKFIGFDSFAANAAVGAMGTAIPAQFSVPVIVEPGLYVGIAARNMGTVTTTGVILNGADFDAYYE